MKAPDITEIEVTLYFHQCPYSKNIVVTTCDMSQQGYTLLGTHTDTFPVPQVSPVDLINLQIDTLKNQQQKILADAQIKAGELEDKIQRLLCIEHQPSFDKKRHIPF
ncbi:MULTISPECIES: hypothetical protein [Brenneria]|uniref:Uncharacterized protein n=1 Tax=Brenneria nigrifluens DSM 30175 = ATCC 13028 TaxID=1121120 RepID=A0A2U1UUY6_9GAMM|nr:MULTISPECIES: hypothetical protein [Brenneria]EHD22100.1 hypothetical protein BrE312_2724 [Brenneria sp. EniD312]PWC25430.1 hypothetical protein DDT54_05910 [Brenneria nigrifluens DSM 30175 = ATCC 13028]QCR05180.1 hypothetical protein EH206_13865 [Brenneria nigrifluens DSM 30175 = ATCC 13028]